MRNFFKTQITSELISEQLTETNMSAVNCIAQDDLVLVMTECAGMSFEDCKLKKNISFINCEISNDIRFKGGSIKENLNINGCDLDGDLFLFDTCVGMSINITSSNIKGKVYLDSSSCKELIILNSSCDGIYFISSEKPGSVESIKINRTKSSSKVVIRGASSVENIELLDSDFLDFTFESSSTKINFNLNTKGCRINDFLYRSIFPSISKSSINLIDSTMNNISFFNTNLNQCDLYIVDTVVNKLLKFKKCQYDECKIDFSESDIVSLSLDDSVLDFIDSNEKYSPIFNCGISNSSKVGMLKKIKDSFFQDHQNSKEDKTYYILKNAEYKHLIESASIFKKIPLYISLFFFSYILGWGVRLKPPFIFSIISIFIYSIVCFIQYRLYDSKNTLVLFQSELVGIKASIILAVSTFFGQTGDVVTSFPLNPIQHILFFIFGVLMITLITGIVIRKLVR